MNLIKPNKLQIGDTIGIIAPAGEVNIEKIHKAKKYLESIGYKVKLGSNIDKTNNYLAGSDDERAYDLNNAFADPEIKAIICARGGYGSIRLLDKIDYKVIKNNPKIFCGYSDITALSAIILKNTGLITFSGAMVQSDFATDELNNYTLKSFFDTLCGNEIILNPQKPVVYLNGNAKGLLLGGNLSTLTSLCGLDFIPDKDFIFFAEDLNEPVYKIDRYFTQLLNIKDFKQHIKAVILGDFLDIDNNKYFENLFESIAKELNIPIISGYPKSHSKKKATVPYGASAALENCTLKIKDFTV